MSRIKGRDTRPERSVRAYLTQRGVKYRCNVRGLPGSPDIAIKKYKLVLEVRGCFWHGHENCRGFRLPSSRKQYWKEKIETNRKRDKRNLQTLSELGYTVFEVWECELREGRVSGLDDFVDMYRSAKDRLARQVQ